MRVAVTGGAGFIGSHVVDRLADAGSDVVVIDRVPPLRHDVRFVQAEVTDLEAVVAATRGCEVVFHLAAVADVNQAFRAPAEAVTVNVLGTASVWEACRRNDVGRAVLASTVWVYGAAAGPEPLGEDQPFDLPRAGHLYTSTKLAAEMVAHSYLSLYGQPFTILRYGIPFGPRMRDELVIARFVAMARAGERITIHGDGSQVRNYLYVEDLADAHLLALGDHGENQVFNLDGREPVSVRRVVDAVASAVERPLAVEFVAARAGDYPGRAVSSAKARRVLGWAPATPFEEGVRRYVAWRADLAVEAAPPR